MQTKVILSVDAEFAGEVDLEPSDWGLLLCEDDHGARFTIAGRRDLAEFSAGPDLGIREEVESYLDAGGGKPLERSGWPVDWDSARIQSDWRDLNMERL